MIKCTKLNQSVTWTPPPKAIVFAKYALVIWSKATKTQIAVTQRIRGRRRHKEKCMKYIPKMRCSYQPPVLTQYTGIDAFEYACYAKTDALVKPEPSTEAVREDPKAQDLIGFLGER